MPPPSSGYVLRTPPYRFDRTPAAATTGSLSLPTTYHPPVVGPGAGVGLGWSAPFLYTYGTAGAYDAQIVGDPHTPYQDDFLAFYPAGTGRPGYVVRAPRTVVLLTAGIDPVSVGVSQALPACVAAGASLLVANRGRLAAYPVLTGWGPTPLVMTGTGPAPSTEEHVAPEAWSAGDVLALYCAESFYATAQVYYSGAPGYTGFVPGAWAAAGQAMFGRMLARCRRFRGAYLYDPSPPPPDVPDPDDPGVENVVPVASAWPAIVGPYTAEWELAPVAGGQTQAAFGAQVAARVAAFWA